METSVEEIAGRVSGLAIADDAARDCAQKHSQPACSQQVPFQNAVHSLIQSTNTISSYAHSITSVLDNQNSSSELSVTEVCSLHTAIKELTDRALNLRNTIDALNDAAERSIILHLRSLGGQHGTVPFKLISHFDKQIKGIVREVLSKASDQEVLWKVAEECYKQAVSPVGSLDAEEYFIPLEEACLEWPYDPDFESEEYYEHENRLDVDEHYTTAFHAQTERRAETRRKERQTWPDFWIKVLNSSPAGPTLFYPPASFHVPSVRADAIPQYLFRTFDAASSGRNDESVIASAASIAGSVESSRIDILKLGQQRATELLSMHLQNVCFEADESDNLVSWTSSLLFAIQYAVWRSRIGGRHPSEIKVCVVDTRKFPPGQFLQDISLLKAYYPAARRLGGSTQSFFGFRLEKEDYYNGEYLSQGSMSHRERSCVVSLEQLIQAGLFQLYPEFEDRKGRDKWNNRVLELRQKWLTEQGTTDEEIRLALNVAYTCFTQFEPSEIASIFLTFKNRKCRSKLPSG